MGAGSGVPYPTMVSGVLFLTLPTTHTSKHTTTPAESHTYNILLLGFVSMAKCLFTNLDGEFWLNQIAIYSRYPVVRDRTMSLSARIITWSVYLQPSLTRLDATPNKTFVQIFTLPNTLSGNLLRFFSINI